MTRYVVVSNCPRAFFLGRYRTEEAVEKAIEGAYTKWCIYEEVSATEILERMAGRE